jgi:hypothetical protein
MTKREELSMTTVNEPHPIWTDGDVMEAMHAMQAVLGEWEQVGAAEDVDLDAMDDVEERFTLAIANFEAAMKQCHRRRRKSR